MERINQPEQKAGAFSRFLQQLTWSLSNPIANILLPLLMGRSLPSAQEPRFIHTKAIHGFRWQIKTRCCLICTRTRPLSPKFPSLPVSLLNTFYKAKSTVGSDRMGWSFINGELFLKITFKNNFLWLCFLRTLQSFILLLLRYLVCFIIIYRVCILTRSLQR